ncbi:hypothetical protein TWF694_006362 [Orbilia ellipsospora]|uniref:Uncharacterized protein n=1 Tax=Orbilia ellipsospora TaxID=2528407 RepID=A0AAV9XNB1_9PEZI
MLLTQEIPCHPASHKSDVLDQRYLPKTPPPTATSHSFNLSASNQKLIVATTNLNIITPPSTPPQSFQLPPSSKPKHKKNSTHRAILTRLDTSTTAALSFTTTTLLTLTARIASVDEALQLYHDTIHATCHITPPSSPSDLEFKNDLVRDIIQREGEVTRAMCLSAERMLAEAEYTLYRNVSKAEEYEEKMVSTDTSLSISSKGETGEVRRRIRRLEAVQRIVSRAAMEMECVNALVEKVGFTEGRREMVKVLEVVLEELEEFMKGVRGVGEVKGRVELDVKVLKVQIRQLVRFGKLVPRILGFMGC